MDEQPTQQPADPAAEFRAELARRGMVITEEGRARARARLAQAAAEWPPERFAALRERTRQEVAKMFGHTEHSHTPAT